MPFAVVLRRDPAGPCVVVVRDPDEPLAVSPGVSYKVVAQSDDHGEALGVAALVERAIRSGELA